jgi:hypothetical protein
VLKTSQERKDATLSMQSADKKTDVSWDIFICNMKNQFWALGCGLGWTVKKKVWADYEQLLRPIF